MKRQVLAWSVGLLAASVSALLFITHKPERRVARDLLDHGIIRSTSDLQFVVKSNDLRENVFLFEVKTDGVVVAFDSRHALRIRAVDQPNSDHGLKALGSTLKHRLNRELNGMAHSVWTLESDELRAVQVFLVEEPEKSFLVVAYH